MTAIDIDANTITLGKGVDCDVALIDDDESSPTGVIRLSSYHNWSSKNFHLNPSWKLQEDRLNNLAVRMLKRDAVKHEMKTDHTSAGSEYDGI